MAGSGAGQQKAVNLFKTYCFRWRVGGGWYSVFMTCPVVRHYIPLLPSITSDCCRLDDYVSLHYLLKHMAHLVQAAVWTAGLDDRLTDSGLISFQLCKAYAPPVGVKARSVRYACIQRAGISPVKTTSSFYLGRFDGGTVFRCIMISPGRYSGRIEGEGDKGSSSCVPDSFNACSNTIGANERKSAGVLTGL